VGEAGFASYLLARWPALVRTLVLLGATPADADRLARDTLVRCHPEFDRVSRDGDPDVHVYRRLLGTWLPRHATEPDDGYRHVGGAAVHDPTVTDPEARVALLGALQDALGGLPPEQRLVVVLRFGAELDPQQVADVLELPVEVVTAREADGLERLAPEALARGRL
jgi:DNA-directed RNA polymerase specialized sigma24 family protein